MTSAAQDACPKCGKDKTAGVENCPRCGLVFALWNPDNAPKQSPLDERAETLWQEVVAHWTSDEKHDAFLKYCSVAGLLGAAGRRYRDRLQGGTDEIATRMQKRVLGMASALLGEPAKPPPPSFVRSGTFLVIVIACAIAGMMGAFALFRRTH